MSSSLGMKHVIEQFRLVRIRMDYASVWPLWFYIPQREIRVTIDDIYKVACVLFGQRGKVHIYLFKTCLIKTSIHYPH